MNRRTFAAGIGSACLPLAAGAQDGSQEVELDGTRLKLWHGDSRLHVQFDAPTNGWIAVGFNNEERLKDTRFVIGAMLEGGFHAEEHIALVPAHPTVQSLGLSPALDDLSGNYSANRSSMSFSLPHFLADSENPTLSPGTITHLMLAWSRDTDFDHHSAWRRHISVRL